jgi:hypothetical protein
VSSQTSLDRCFTKPLLSRGYEVVYQSPAKDAEKGQRQTLSEAATMMNNEERATDVLPASCWSKYFLTFDKVMTKDQRYVVAENYTYVTGTGTYLHGK